MHSGLCRFSTISVLFWSSSTTFKTFCIFLLHRQLNFMRSLQWWNTSLMGKLIDYIIVDLLQLCRQGGSPPQQAHSLRYTTHATVVKGPIYRSSWTRGTILSCRNCSSGEATDVSQIFAWLLALYWSPPTTENNLLDLILQMFVWATSGRLRWQKMAFWCCLLREVDFNHMVTLNVHLHPKQWEKLG